MLLMLLLMLLLLLLAGGPLSSLAAHIAALASTAGSCPDRTEPKYVLRTHFQVYGEDRPEVEGGTLE